MDKYFLLIFLVATMVTDPVHAASGSATTKGLAHSIRSKCDTGDHADGKEGPNSTVCVYLDSSPWYHCNHTSYFTPVIGHLMLQNCSVRYRQDYHA